jgi:hypothetical protein
VDHLETTGDDPRTDHVHLVKKALHTLSRVSPIGVVPYDFCRATCSLPDCYDNLEIVEHHLAHCAGIARLNCQWYRQ